MSRTTLDIDGPILRDLKRLQRKTHQSLGRLVSDLLAKALALQGPGAKEEPRLNWISKDSRPLVDLADKEAVWRLLDSPPDGSSR
jgi:hypothetical protein